MIAAGSAWLAEQLELNEATAIVYRRESLGVEIPIDCVVGRVSPQKQALADGRVNLEEEPADFLIRPVRLDFGSGPVEPERGDRITVDGRVYELTDRDGEPCWRPDNQYRTMYRVRTVRQS